MVHCSPPPQGEMELPQRRFPASKTALTLRRLPRALQFPRQPHPASSLQVKMIKPAAVRRVCHVPLSWVAVSLLFSVLEKKEKSLFNSMDPRGF